MFLNVLCLTCIAFLDFLVLVDPDDFTDATDKTDPGADILEENNVPIEALLLDCGILHQLVVFTDSGTSHSSTPTVHRLS